MEPELIAAARLVARLLLRELDAPTLQELRDPPIAAALAGVGIALPSDDELEALQAEFVDLFLHPARGAPPIASLWVDGQYEGDRAVALRSVATALGFELDPVGAGGAPADHLGCLLLLWCEAAIHDPTGADHFARAHLDWVPRALAAINGDPGFYGSVGRAATALTHAMATSPGPDVRGDAQASALSRGET
ncbi:MAG: molecular chaperone TorD family protein [Planctomycetota bacterium]